MADANLIPATTPARDRSKPKPGGLKLRMKYVEQWVDKRRGGAKAPPRRSLMRGTSWRRSLPRRLA